MDHMKEHEGDIISIILNKEQQQPEAPPSLQTAEWAVPSMLLFLLMPTLHSCYDPLPPEVFHYVSLPLVVVDIRCNHYTYTVSELIVIGIFCQVGVV